MAPLNLERLNPETNSWEPFFRVKQGSLAGPIQNYLPNGSCEVYIFHCNGNNSMSSVFKSSLEAKIGRAGKLASLEVSPLRKYKELRRGESVEIQIRMGLRKKPITIKLAHF